MYIFPNLVKIFHIHPVSIFQITAFIVIPMTTNRGILVGCLISGGFVFFLIVSYVGQKLLANIESKMQEQSTVNEMNHTNIEPKIQEESAAIEMNHRSESLPEYSQIVA